MPVITTGRVERAAARRRQDSARANEELEQARQRNREATARADESYEAERLGNLSDFVNRAIWVEAEALGVQPNTSRQVVVAPGMPRGHDVVVSDDYIVVSPGAQRAIEGAFGEEHLSRSETIDTALRLQNVQQELFRAVLGGTTFARETDLRLTQSEQNLQYAIRGALATSQRPEFMGQMFAGQPDTIAGVDQRLGEITPEWGTATASGALWTVGSYVASGIGEKREEIAGQGFTFDPDVAIDQEAVVKQLAHSTGRPGGAREALTRLSLVGYNPQLAVVFDALDPAEQAGIVDRVSAAVDPALSDRRQPTMIRMADGALVERSWFNDPISRKEQRKQGFGSRDRLSGLQAATEMHKAVIDVAEELGMRDPSRSAEREKADYELFMATKARGQTFGKARREAGHWRTAARRAHVAVRAKELGGAAVAYGLDKAEAGWDHTKSRWRKTRTGFGQSMHATVSFGKSMMDLAGDRLADGMLWADGKATEIGQAHRDKRQPATPDRQRAIDEDTDFGR